MKKKILSLTLALTIVLAMLTGCAGTSSSDGDTGGADGSSDYPSRSISVIVPFDAGGATDLIARAMQPKMEESLNGTMAITNMSGGNTAVGNQFVLDSDPDGYTIVAQATEIANLWTMNQSDITYRDFQYIGMAAAVPGSGRKSRLSSEYAG